MRDKSPTGIAPRVRTCRDLPARERDACWLELMAIATFKGGLNYNVVNAKWDAIRDVFHGFDLRKVAAMTPEDVARVEADPRIIHNKRKIESVVANARTMLDIQREYGGLGEWLDSMPDPDTRIAQLHRRFLFMGPTTAYYFLHYSGEELPPPHEWASGHPGSRILPKGHGAHR